MKKLIVFFLTLISLSNLNAQSNERIINDMLFDLFSRPDTVFIVSEISKPVFDYDSATIEDKTGLKLPDNIITEWRKHIESHDSVIKWNEFELNNSYFKNYTFVGKKPVIKCIEKSQRDVLLKQKRIAIFTISNIVFDDKRENAIFRFSTNGQGVFIEDTILIKKYSGNGLL